MQIQSRFFVLTMLAAACLAACNSSPKPVVSIIELPAPTDSAWAAPDPAADTILSPQMKLQLLYGQELIAHTSKYFGPKGIISHTANGMNCQNCHLDAGRKSWGNNFGAVFANYPRSNPRSSNIQTVYVRINDCFQRSMNGKALDSNSKEMLAMFAYINWLGKNIARNVKPVGSGLEKVAYINRAASPDSGAVIYQAKCSVCHGKNGQGLMAASGLEYTYPPLWGPNSYNNGAGLYRLSGFAAFVKNNMPYLQASHKAPVLTIEQAWDVAAYVNSQPRPAFDQKNDWKKPATKPIDFPFGPYADTFSEKQHKYGPYQPIVAARK